MFFEGPVQIFCDLTERECPVTRISHGKLEGEEVRSCDHHMCHDAAMMYYPITDAQMTRLVVIIYDKPLGVVGIERK